MSIMKNDLIRVLTQYIDENGKPKGGQEFFFYADADEFMYAPQEAIQQAIQSMIDLEMMAKRDCGRYEYREHQIIFHHPIQLLAKFNLELNKVEVN